MQQAAHTRTLLKSKYLSHGLQKAKFGGFSNNPC